MQTIKASDAQSAHHTGHRTRVKDSSAASLGRRIRREFKLHRARVTCADHGLPVMREREHRIASERNLYGRRDHHRRRSGAASGGKKGTFQPLGAADGCACERALGASSSMVFRGSEAGFALILKLPSFACVVGWSAPPTRNTEAHLRVGAGELARKRGIKL